MVTGINTSGISIGADGKIKISGLASSIDSKAIIEAQMAAKRIAAVKLENKISANATKIAAYGELKSKASAVNDALDMLRGSTSLTTTNVFKVKSASGTTAPADGAPVNHVPSSVDALMTASIEQSAAMGTHTIKIEQLAKAHQVRGDVATTTNTALGLNGDFEINGQVITLAASDSLLDVRSKINAVGTTAGVTATIVSASSNQHYLVLTSNKTGEDFEIDFDGGNTITDLLGLTDGTWMPGGAIKNELQEAKNAVLTVNGITGIERNSNEINDVIEGVTLKLTKAEADTEISLKIESDLNTVKSALVDLVNAYNELRSFATEQRTASDLNKDGTVADNEFGPLAYDSTMRTILDKLSELAVASKDTNTDGYRSLGQLGITMDAQYNLKIDDSVLDSRLLADVDSVRKLFAYETTVSDSRVTVLGRTSDTTAGTYYLSVAGTDIDGNVTSANIHTTNGPGAGGGNDGTVSVNGQVLTVLTGPAKGLQMLYDGGFGGAGVDGITVTVSRGIADTFYDFFNDTVKASSGTLDGITSQLQVDSEDFQKRVDTIDSRLEITKKTLETKFIAMETALAQLAQLRNTITSYFDAGNKDS